MFVLEVDWGVNFLYVDIDALRLLLDLSEAIYEFG
jgi:hypothetical protein